MKVVSVHTDLALHQYKPLQTRVLAPRARSWTICPESTPQCLALWTAKPCMSMFRRQRLNNTSLSVLLLHAKAAFCHHALHTLLCRSKDFAHPTPCKQLCTLWQQEICSMMKLPIAGVAVSCYSCACGSSQSTCCKVT